MPGDGETTTFDMTLTALGEVNPLVRFVLAVIGPNRAGDPMLGLLGFMDYDDRLDLVRAADLAHRRAGTDGWRDEGQTVEQMAEFISSAGGWRSPGEKWRQQVAQALVAYRQWPELNREAPDAG